MGTLPFLVVERLSAMACCAALTLLFSLGYRVIRWVAPGLGDEDFAPAATWPPTELAAQTRPHRGQPVHETVGRACIVLGLAWFVAGMLAMHAFGVLSPIRSVPADIVFHSSGLWLATAGLALLFLYRPAQNLTRSTA
jgi:hypothetical protein